MPRNSEPCDILDVGLGTQGYETDSLINLPKAGRKCAKRVDSIWGAWFFFSFYFKPALNDKSKAKIVRDSNGVSGFDKSDLKLDVFIVQHDMENMSMWVFKERPENGDVLDFSLVGSKKRKDFFLHGNDEECHLAVNSPSNPIPETEMHPSEPHWLNDFIGMMKNDYRPVTAAKSVYEDELGYLIIIILSFVDLPSVKVSWRNTLTRGIIKVSCMSTSRSFIKRHDRTFKLTDPSSEHCPPGDFVREIPLSTRIPEDANIEAYYDGPGSVLEIMVPKLQVGPEEHEVRVCLCPHLGGNMILC